MSKLDDENFKKFTVTYQVLACPMSLDKAKEYVDEDFIINERTDAEGYLVKNFNTDMTVWFPKHLFEETYSCSETALDRMKIELSELDEKIDKLKSFILNNDTYTYLSIRKQELMTQQLIAMQEYSTVLVARIAYEKDIYKNARNSDFSL